MQRSFRHFVSVALAALLAPGCSGNDPASPEPVDRSVPQELAADVSSVAESNTAFALDLFGRIRGESGNLVFSPISISAALAMTMAGAAGQTESQMSAALRFTMSPAAVHPAFGAVLQSLNRGNGRNGYALALANRLWGQEGAPFQEEFLAVTRDDYAAPMAPADFVHDPEGERTAINRWVEDRTLDRIQNLFPQGTINDLTRLVLVNAIVFDGDWKVPFDPEETRSLPFHRGPGQTVQVPMMAAELKIASLQDEHAHVVRLPYATEELSMVLALPHEDLETLERALTPELLAGWFGIEGAQAIPVTLPRFSFASEPVMVPALKDLGILDAFSPGVADFSRITGDRSLHIQTVVHQAFIAVDEHGTEAAAATGVGVGTTSVPVPFRADRPFLFFIVDHVTETLLFMGRVADPSAG